jgi:hypothetical protein
MNIKRTAAAAALAASLALAPTALASGGGVNSGGVNSGGVNTGGGGGATTTVSGGGGGGGGVNSGGVNGGGGKTVAGCATINSLSNSTGYWSTFAAIWTNYSIANSCNSPISFVMDYTNQLTGNVDFSEGGSVVRGSGGGLVDEDWAAVATPYTVQLSVEDSSGNVLTSRSTSATTGPGL